MQEKYKVMDCDGNIIREFLFLDQAETFLKIRPDMTLFNRPVLIIHTYHTLFKQHGEAPL